MVPVVEGLEPGECLIESDPERVGKSLHVGSHLGVQLLFRDAADSRVRRVHGDVHEVVELGEHRELAELRDPCEEHEAKIGVARLEGDVQTAHYLTKTLEFIVIINDVQQGGIILVNEHDHATAGSSP